MLKVLLVDDEPFIIQGLKVIIDWENEEFEIAGTASNGKEALQFLENENVDLVIADNTLSILNLPINMFPVFLSSQSYRSLPHCPHQILL